MTEWRKSSYSTAGENCVEVSEGAKTCVRDTQHRHLGSLHVSAREWEAFVEAVRL